MKAFVILAESSSFNNAAKLLNITQPALTRSCLLYTSD
ncbi:helix-turn-helix domain-containing protein, partial [Pseudomonas aeruginosa]